MADNSVWPVVFIAWKSKSDQAMEATREGQLDAYTGKLHARKGAPCLVVTEDGKILGAGEVADVSKYDHEISLDGIAGSLEKAPQISKSWLEKLKSVPNGFLKRPISGIFAPPDKDDAVLSREWFDQVRSYALKSLKKTTSSSKNNAERTKKQGDDQSDKGKKNQERKKKKAKKTSVSIGDDAESESLLTSWIPSALEGLLEDHVRSDQWEVVVAYAFRALGFDVELRGQQNPGQAEPDCIATYTSATGQMIKLVIDAKAGQWNAPVDDVRAMRDYMALSEAYARPVFVANSLGKNVDEKLHEHVMQGKTASAMSGRDLALLIKQRLTDPDFDVELELRQIVW